MDKTELKQKMLSGALWQTLERFGLQGFTFLLQLILARLLLPSDFGVVVLLDVFIQISWCFVDSGLGTSMIQCREATERDFSGVYWLSQGIAQFLYLFLFLLAPAVAQFYKIEQLSSMLRVSALGLFFIAHSSVCTAIVNRRLQFRKNFLIGFPATICGGIAGLVLAFCGYGAWSLVWMQLLTSIFRMCFGIYQTRWMPDLYFNAALTKKMFILGYKLLTVNIIDTLCNNMPSFVIGKLFPAAEVGFYAKARKLPFFFANGLRFSVTGTVFPALSAEQDSFETQRKIVAKGIISSSFLLFPFLTFLIGQSKTIILVFLGEKWLPAVPYMRILSISFFFFIIQNINIEILIANGKGTLLLKLESINKILFVLLFCGGLFFGIYGILWGMTCSAFVSYLIFTYGCRKILSMGFLCQVSLVWRTALVSGVMGVCVYVIDLATVNAFILLPLEGLVCVAVYLLFSYLLNRQQFLEMVNMAKPLLLKLKNKGVTQ